MVDIKELRIGNYLNLNSQLFKVKKLSLNGNFYSYEIDKNLVCGCYCNPLPCYREVECVSTKDLSPITLTSELLEKCGFVYENVFDSYWSPDLRYLKETKEGFYLYDNENCCCRISKSIHFLHQLQNMYYCLTNQELNVKL